MAMAMHYRTMGDKRLYNIFLKRAIEALESGDLPQGMANLNKAYHQYIRDCNVNPNEAIDEIGEIKKKYNLTD